MAKVLVLYYSSDVRCLDRRHRGIVGVEGHLSVSRTCPQNQRQDRHRDANAGAFPDGRRHPTMVADAPGVVRL